MKSIWPLLSAATLAACQPGSSTANAPSELNDASNRAQAVVAEDNCPFTFPTPNVQLDSTNTPSLLEFPVFNLHETLDLQGADGKITQFRAWSAHSFNEDGRLNQNAAIGYVQNLKGWKVLFTPDEKFAEFDRIDNNAIFTFEADTMIDVIEVDGIEGEVHFAIAEASRVATLMLPINDGEFFHPVSIGVYPGMAGCEETTRAAFGTVMANLSLNLDNPNYHNSEDIQQIMADKRKGL